MNTPLLQVSAIILAGGKSRRMGRDKAFLEFDGRLLIERVIERVHMVSNDVIIVCNDVDAYARFGERIVTDRIPGKGSLGGLYSGLLAAREEYVFAVACDMPFVNQDLVRYMISLATQYDVVIPHAHDPSGRKRQDKKFMSDHPMAKEKDLHPMHAIYSKRCLSIIAERLQTDDLRLIGFLPDARTRIVEAEEIDRFDPRHLSFFNANTPEDYALARSLRGTDMNIPGFSE